VWLGGFAEATIRRAATRFDGWFPTPPSPEAFTDGWRIAREAAGERSIDGAVYLTVNVDPDPSKAEAETERYALDYYGIPLEVMRGAQSYFVGDTDACAAWLRDYVDAGATHLVLRVASLDPMPQVKAIAERVLPAVRGS
jgi:alkanesulfonate monooxygenase SsuD/methylene tetrahydromethanopterin reductase-like flavin-dependent oxidoreductase (luciferase family)